MSSIPRGDPSGRYAPESGPARSEQDATPVATQARKAKNFPTEIKHVPGALPFKPGNALQICETNPDRLEIWLYNASKYPMAVGDSRNVAATVNVGVPQVTPSQAGDPGQPIPPGALVIIDTTYAALYASWGGPSTLAQPGFGDLYVTDISR